jgi:hypothetical protein
VTGQVLPTSLREAEDFLDFVENRIRRVVPNNDLWQIKAFFGWLILSTPLYFLF